MPMRRRAQAQANSAAPPNLVPHHFALASVKVVNNLRGLKCLKYLDVILLSV
jgi:hypothetical protein